MRFSDGFLDELISRLSLAQVAGRKVTWDPKKTNPGKGDYWAPCPFHQEKTASFHVDDQKGYYYCFGCHKKGNAFRFVQETENVNFVEAVEILATEAGLELPKRDPKAARVYDRKKRLIEVMEAANKVFRLELSRRNGEKALRYLSEERRLSQATINQFELGFAPDAWQNLSDALTKKGIPQSDLLEAGLIKASQKEGRHYDVFRNRIMFPIRDPRGQLIAFGGRTMAEDDMAKYLNSPETPLFNKSQTLYNFHQAREAAGKENALIICEGYMDVIALAQAGFSHAVAPLGTALTDAQLHLSWRLASEPIIALDGDQAGLRAGNRVIDFALPLISAGKSLRFAYLPVGQDPDDVLRSEGRDAMRAIFEGAVPFVSAVWQRETKGKEFDTPERRAALDKTLREMIGKIKDADLRRHYSDAIFAFRRAHFQSPERRATPSKAFAGRGLVRRVGAASDAAKQSILATNSDLEVQNTEGVILMASALHPRAALKFVTRFEKLHLETASYRPFFDALIAALHDANDDIEALKTRMHEEFLPKIEAELKKRHILGAHPYLKSEFDPALVEMTLEEALIAHEARAGFRRELQEAEEDINAEENSTETLTKRLSAARNAYASAKTSRVLASSDADKEEAEARENLNKVLAAVSSKTRMTPED